MSNRTADHHRRAAVTDEWGSQRSYLPPVFKHQRNGTNTLRDDNDALQRSKALPNDNGLTLENTESLSNVGAELVAASSKKSYSVTGLYQDYQENRKRRFEGGTDTSALICDFFSQGWCVKGDSCRFLHMEAKGVPSRESELPTHISKWSRSYMSFGSTSRNLDPLSSQEFSDSEREYDTYRSASLQKTSSMFFGSEYGNPYKKPVSADIQHSVGYITEMSSYSPSTPFLPSFPLTQSLLSSVNQFNSIHDSMEQSKPGEVHSRCSDACRGSLECHFFEQSLGVENNVHDNISNEQHYVNDLVPVETVAPVTSIIEMHNAVAAPQEEKLLGSSHLRDLTKRSTPNTGNNCATQTDKQKTESVHMAGREADVEIREDMSKDQEYLRMFRVALIEYVKDLLKPAWREGKLSKTAHKLIVKKTVDKVMSTTKQLPSSPESEVAFHSSLKQSIANFSEYYIDKYGKL